ncbi:MAG: hypothetical protein KGY45_01360 [Hadesarchaea archaeon]|nr:hypothetical protein [Hadesarchaea archaeon]
MKKMEISEGDVLRVEGSLVIQVSKGEVTISGGLHGEGEKVEIPKAKSLPLEALTDAVIEYKKEEGGEIEHLPERTIPPEWDSLVEEIIEKKPKTIIVMGQVDTGKTFFTTYVANSLLRHEMKSAVVDTDIGQSDVGPPGTIGMGIVDKPISLMTDVQTQDSYFVGSMSPSGHMLEFMVGMKKVAERGLEKSDLVIVDTPGWVFGGPGRALQLYGAELLEPDLVVALQRENELEHLLKSMPSQVRRISVSEKVRERSKSERSFLRQETLSKYFDGSKELNLDLEKVRLERCYLGTGEEINPDDLGVEGVLHAEEILEGLVIVTESKLSEEDIQALKNEYGKIIEIKKGSEKHVLVSLIDENNDLLSVGLINEINYEEKKLSVITPIQNGGLVSAIQIGSMKIKPNGEEIGTVRPGSF